MLETNARKGLQVVSITSWVRRRCCHGYAYYKPTRDGPVDMDEALKAEQSVEPFKGMQFCAAADDIEERRAATSAVELNPISLFVFERTLRGRVDDSF